MYDRQVHELVCLESRDWMHEARCTNSNDSIWMTCQDYARRVKSIFRLAMINYYWIYGVKYDWK